MGQNSWQRRRRSLKQTLRQEWQSLAIAPTVALLIIGLNGLGFLQGSEWAVVDQFFRWRSFPPLDDRIVVITVDDQDNTQIGHWPIPDEVLAEALLKIEAQRPRFVGLDLYRDLSVGSGQDRLESVFKSNPNLIGIEKRFGGQQVPPPKALAQLNQTGIADLIEDADGTVRRGLISARDDQTGQVYLSLSAVIALKYLESEGIQLEPIEGTSQLKLGRAHFSAFSGNDGAYVNADDSGYQILMNWQNLPSQFRTLSMTTVLKGEIPPNLLRDRIVLIGSTTESTHDFFWTPYTTSRINKLNRMPGVFIHANLISQILRAALDGQPFIQVMPDWVEQTWILLWSFIGWQVSRYGLQTNGFTQWLFYGKTILLTLGVGGGLVFISYLLFLGSLWIPIAAPLLGLTFSALVSIGLHNQKLQHLAYIDSLTQVANRRYFDQFLAERSHTVGDLSVILCDIDCFKTYNDTYGHQAGDDCLQQVATALRQAVRKSDLVCRYGGEEFAIILPYTDLTLAAQVAERVLSKVRSLNMVHINSLAQPYVTLSCGIAWVAISKQHLQSPDWSPVSLLAEADAALYQAKTSGRDRYVIRC
ncbi:MAG: CHASE2 domain-containing protein [Drouetiella hepatica Uher 2000/2452]|jgi:diguanylate cyclase (GGDEF)-like protein|uniref:CHASE2 domain-containing protein n=1 Tax=Drouetiella hepatica Uher 2000/2452 TaxID=904376 RepID=A0A951Q8T7_9CYAN|nr:CHASE2 domain-containing protein [Drouetiella hepatica Uher 2000/2452]